MTFDMIDDYYLICDLINDNLDKEQRNLIKFLNPKSDMYKLYNNKSYLKGSLILVSIKFDNPTINILKQMIKQLGDYRIIYNTRKIIINDIEKVRIYYNIIKNSDLKKYIKN